MPKQLEIPGAERPKIKEIEEAAEGYVNLRDKRMRILTQEIAAKENLLQIMIAHSKDLPKNAEGEVHYRYDDELVILKPGKNNVKVKAVHDDGDDDDE